MKIVIIGAGPTGLGAAWRLNQLEFADWELWEQDAIPGGLARSVTDEEGFTWDIGGHVQFSHYQTFDEVMNQALGEDGWLHHERESWVRVCGVWVPYPFQYNIHRLPKDKQLECVEGLLSLNGNGARPFENFEDLIHRVFGAGVAKLFMLPYNYKVWAYPPSDLATAWIGERVAIPDMRKIMESVILGRDNVSWGPNNTFRFPKFGGTGAIWKSVAAMLPGEKVFYGRAIQRIDAEARVIFGADGSETSYDALITTIPLDLLVRKAQLEHLAADIENLRFSTVHIVGVGLKGQPAQDISKKCWMYFPEDNSPFYRVTVFSNYSPNNVPDINRYWSLMAEISQSPKKPVNEERLIEDTIQGMVNTGLIQNREQVNHTWNLSIERGYPTPNLGRDKVLETVLPALERMGIYSRGRFGAWKYEVSNQDHSFMQGVEAVQHILYDAPELTLWFPNVVNNLHPVFGKEWL